MKRIVALLFLITFTLLGCQSDTALSIKELERVDPEVEQIIRIEEGVRLVYAKERAYLVFYSADDVSVDLEEDGDTIIVHLDVEETDGQEMKRHVYAVSMEPEHDTVEVHMNGELGPFDDVIV